MVKIALVGAGSVVFAQRLITDILQFPAFADATISLMDIDAGRLGVIEKLTKRIIRQLGVKARVEATLDLRTALTGARFAVTTVQVGGYRPGTVIDFEIPAKYGVKQTIADTLGVGGVFRALRSIPVLANVAAVLQEVGAPDSLLLNYTNPMAMNMWAIDRLTGAKAVGLCHSVQGTSRQLADYCALNYSDISYLVAGINHMAFFLKFEYKGKDAYPFLFRALDDPGAFTLDRVRFEMMRRLGYFVTESSEHQSEYVPYFIQHGEEVMSKFGVPINEYIRRCETMVGRWDEVEQRLLDESTPLPITRSVEYGSTIINSVVTGDPSVIYGNVPNRHLITNLPQGCCVEVPCLVDKQGLQPTHIGDLPPQLASIIRTNVNVQELTVEAAVTRQREYVYQAVMADPHTASVLPLDKIWEMCDEMIEAHQKEGYLGDFKPVIRNTGRPLSTRQRVYLSLAPASLPFAGGAKEAHFRLVAENLLDETFEGDVTLVSADAAICFPQGNEVHLSVGAGETVEIPVVITAEQAPEALSLSIVSPSQKTIERDFSMPKRAEYIIPVSEDGSRRLPFEIVWSGNTAAEGHLWLTADDFVLEAQVDDTDLKTTGTHWDGSAIGLAFVDPLKSEVRHIPIIVTPDPETPVAWRWTHRFRTGDPLGTARITVANEASGYRISLRISRAELGIASDAPFLFELKTFINALGTAHGRIGQTWNGSPCVSSDSSRFGLLKPER